MSSRTHTRKISVVLDTPDTPGVRSHSAASSSRRPRRRRKASKSSERQPKRAKKRKSVAHTDDTRRECEGVSRVNLARSAFEVDVDNNRSSKSTLIAESPREDLDIVSVRKSKRRRTSVVPGKHLVGAVAGLFVRMLLVFTTWVSFSQSSCSGPVSCTSCSCSIF